MSISIIILLSINILLLAFLIIRSFSQNLDRTERVFREEIAQNRKEQSDSLKGFSDSLLQGLERVREGVEKRLELIQKDNNTKLEQMRETVDEKLHSTLEKRLTESFEMVGKQLTQVHQGLGEMQKLAVGVGDLKKVLTNVKTRGTLGEVQLESILEQILAADQYERNATVKKRSRERVDFVVKMPGKSKEPLLLPIDAKFPIEDYQRLLEAQNIGDKTVILEAAKALEQRVKLEARSIRDKYINPPDTTDFAVMFLPIEGLYAEVISSGLSEVLRRDYQVSVAGPNTISAFLSSLQFGFRTLAVEKRASEVWRLLGAVKVEFGKFGKLLGGVRTKLSAASTELERVQSKSRNIEGKLGKVQEIPSGEATKMIEDDGVVDVGSE